MCLKSIEKEIGELANAHTIVVDNASGDGSPQTIQDAITINGWSQWASILSADNNNGFASGNNEAIRRSLQNASPPDFFLLLNPDTVILAGAIKALLQLMYDQPNAGIVGSRLEDPNGQVPCAAHRFPSVWSELDNGARLGVLSRWLHRYVVSPPIPQKPDKYDWVSGASMMIRREVFEQIGLFDTGYFLYFEEVDLCYRAQTRRLADLVRSKLPCDSP